jgi:hypothetical protein
MRVKQIKEEKEALENYVKTITTQDIKNIRRKT